MTINANVGKIPKKIPKITLKKATWILFAVMKDISCNVDIPCVFSIRDFINASISSVKKFGNINPIIEKRKKISSENMK